jgi:AAA domain-containing protein
VGEAPSEPHLTHPDVVAQEERILAFAATAHDYHGTPSATVDRAGLDVWQGEVAAAVAGDAPLVLVVGPAGTGKTTALARAVDDLRVHHRPAFGVAPTTKAGKVLRDETGLPGRRSVHTIRRAPTVPERRFGRARESPRPGRQPEDDRHPDVARTQATRPIFAVSLMSATSAFSSRSTSFLNPTQALPMLAFGSRSTYRSAT